MSRRIAGMMVGLALGVAGCGSAPEPQPKTPEQIAEEKAEFDRRMKENIDAIMKRTAPKNPGQVPPDAVPGDRERHRKNADPR